MPRDAGVPRRTLRSRRAPILLLLVAVALPFIGRSVTTVDGAEMVSESLGLFVQGHFGLGRMPPADASAPESAPPFHSKYGLFPSLLPLPTLGPAWWLRAFIGAEAVDALIGLTWFFGVFLAGLAFGSLVRALRPDATGPWEAAFVAGTFLWPYAAESFVEPFAAAGLACGAALALSGRSRTAAAVPWAAACLLKPILWITVPVLVLVLALAARQARAAREVWRALGVFGLALCLQGAANFALSGSLLETGYGAEVFLFTTPLGDGLFGLLLSPGRSVFLYAPVTAVGLLGLSRVPRPAAVLCAGVPLLQLVVFAQWCSWEGGDAWGPRHLLPVLPLLIAPAVLVGTRAVRAAFLAGALFNIPGVLVSSGTWDAYAERIQPAAGAAWPATGLMRVTTVPALSPLLGHSWLAARNVLGLDVPRPWAPSGFGGGETPPDAASSVSPWLVRRVLGLPAIPPFVPRLLVHSASGDLARGRSERALRWAREALRLSPDDLDARRLVAIAEAEVRRTRPGS